ncbi:MAG TPA: hypothetical protein VJG66_03855 [Patescibacteria group bacterium]|nr:hypothetical protein [Patescibacteria group bacterium]
MQNSLSLKDAIFFLVSLAIACAVVVFILNDYTKTRAAEIQEQTLSAKQMNPAKNFRSLDSYIIYSPPEGWSKQDQVDHESGNNTWLALTSPDFDSPDSLIINSGIKIFITRSYDLKAQDSLTDRLNAQYPTYDYNIRPIKIGGENAMTMHEDYQGHNRFIYIANGSHLWQISIASKNLDSEQEYDLEINSFLDSIRFKD